MDAIDEDDPNLVDNGLFEGTDIPTSYALPMNKYLSVCFFENLENFFLFFEGIRARRSQRMGFSHFCWTSKYRKTIEIG